MRICLQKLLICMLISAMLFSMYACQDPENFSPLEMENEDYRLDKENGKWYLEFKDEDAIPDSEELNVSSFHLADFKSVADFYERLLYSGLPKRALAKAKEAFNRNDDRRILLVDIENLYVPVLPCGCQEYESYRVVWEGSSLSAYIDCTHASFNFTLPPERVTVYPWKFGYDRLYESWIVDYFDDEIILSEEKVEDRNATIYHHRPALTSYQGGTSWSVMYTLIENEKKVEVHEGYTNECWQKENRVPNDIGVFIEENGIRTFCKIYPHNDERPSEEWLLSIGVQPFVPEESPAA